MSSDILWPVATIPIELERKSYQVKPVDIVLRQPTSTGPGLSRPRVTFQPYEYRMTIPMTDAAYKLFLQFFEVALASGSAWFGFNHPLDGMLYVTFTKQLFTPRLEKDGSWLVTVNLKTVGPWIEAP